MYNEEDRKWLYGKMQNAGVDTGSYDDFKASLDNEEDRDWYYQKSVDLGLDVGSKDDFYGMMVDSGEKEPSNTTPTDVTTSSPSSQSPQAAQSNHDAKKSVNAAQGLSNMGFSWGQKSEKPTENPAAWDRRAEKPADVPTEKPVEKTETDAGAADNPFKFRLFDRRSLADRTFDRMNARYEAEQAYQQALDDMNPLRGKSPYKKEEAKPMPKDELVQRIDKGGAKPFFDVPTNKMEAEAIKTDFAANKQLREHADYMNRKAYEEGYRENRKTILDYASKIDKQFKESYDKDRMENAYTFYGEQSAARGEVGSRLLSPATRDLAAAKAQMDEAKKIIENAARNKSDRNAFLGFFEDSAINFKDAITDFDSWDFGMKSVEESQRVRDVLDKFDKGFQLSKSEQSLLDAVAMNTAANLYYSGDQGMGATVGETTGHMIPFMLQIAVSPTTGLGKMASSKVFQQLAKWAAKSTAKKLAAQGAKYGTRLLTDLGSGYLMAGSVGVGHTIADAERRMTGTPVLMQTEEIHYGGREKGDDAIPAYAKAFTSSAIEYQSELVGEYFKPLQEMAGRFIVRGATSRNLGMVGDILRRGIRTYQRYGATPVSKFFDAVNNYTRYDGAVAEYIEELVGNVENAATVGDMEFNAGERGVFNPEHNLETFLSVAVPGFVQSAIKTGAYYGMKGAKVMADKKASSLFGEDIWLRIKEELDAFTLDMTAEDMNAALNDIASRHDLRTADELKAVMRYNYFNLSEKSLDMGVTISKEDKAAEMEDAVEGSKDAGSEMSTPEEVHSAFVDEASAAASLMQTEQGSSLKERIDEMFSMNASSGELSSLIADADASLQEAANAYIRERAKNIGIEERAADEVRDAVESERGRMMPFVADSEAGQVNPVSYQGRRGYIMGREGDALSVLFEDAEEPVIILSTDADLQIGSPVLLSDYLASYEQAVSEHKRAELEQSRVNHPNTKVTPVVDDVIQTPLGARRVAFVNGEGGVFLEEDIYVRNDETGRFEPKHQKEFRGEDAVSASDYVQMQNDYWNGKDIEQKEAEEAKALAEKEAESTENKGRNETVSVPVALEYLLEGGKGSIENAGYFLYGIQAAFPHINSEIQAVRDATSSEELGMAPDAWVASNPQALQDIRALVSETYGEEGVKLFDILLANSTGFYPREGKAVGQAIDNLSPVERTADSAGSIGGDSRGIRSEGEESVLLDDSQAATKADNNTASLGVNSSELSVDKGTGTSGSNQAEGQREDSEVHDEGAGDLRQSDGESVDSIDEGSVTHFRQGERSSFTRAVEKRAEQWRKSGIKVNIVRSFDDVKNASARSAIEAGETVAGWYDVKTGEAYIYLPHNADSRDVDETIIHEVLSHKGLRGLLGEEGYNALCDKVWEVMHPVDRIKFLAYPGVKGDKRAAADEFIAHLVEQERLKPEQQTVWNKIVDFFLNLFNSGIYTNEAKGILSKSDLTRDDISRLIRLSYSEMKRGSSANVKGREGQRFSINDKTLDEVNGSFNEELQQQIDGTLPQGHVYDLGLPSDILRSTGIPGLPIQLNSTRLETKSKNFGHDFDLSEVKDLVKAIASPIAVFSYGNKMKSQNIIVEIQRQGKNFLVGISIRPSVNGRILDINSIRNVFPKNSAEWLNWVNQGKALYLDKEKIQNLIDQQRTILADVEYLDLDSVANILQNFENPKLSDVKNVKDGENRFRIGDNAETYSLNSKQKKDGSDLVGDDVRFKISKNNRKTIEGWLNKRSDLTDAERESFMDYIDEFDASKQLATSKWFANGAIRIPEDMPKVEQAMQVAKKAGVDALQYKSPMDLIERHADIKVKEKRINPDDVPTLSDKKVLSNGIVTYLVEESDESRKNMRKIINTHFGEDSSPWCLLQGDGKGNLTQQSKKYWNHYNAYPKRVAFKDGKLLAFSANDSSDVVWWDKQDASHAGIPVIGKIPNDELGRSATIEYDDAGNALSMTGIHRGNKKNGLYESWYDNGQLWNRGNYKDGRRDGLYEEWYDNGQLEIRELYENGEKVKDLPLDEGESRFRVHEAAVRIEEMFGEVDEERGDVRFSVHHMLSGKQKEEAINDLMSVTGRSRKTVEKWLDAEQSLARVILDEDNVGILDLEADESVPSIWKNSDYPQGTVEFSNICKKRLPFTRIYQRLQKEFPDTLFDAQTLNTIRNTMKEMGEDVACALCFVEDRRQLLGEIGQGFIDAVKGKDVELNDKQADALNKLKKSGDKYVPNLFDIITLDGMKELRKKHPSVAQAFIEYNNARGMQSGRLFQAYSAYGRDILKWDSKKVKSVNGNGGLRIFSFSDFEAHHLIDLVQVLTDCAAKGVKVQGYTKVPEFARAVKDTNAKINRSLIPKGVGYVDADYVPKEGEAVSPNVINGKRLLFDTIEGIDVNNPNFFDSTNSKSVGNILVAINDEQARLAMADPFVDYIIGFHTGQSKAILKGKGIDTWVNYKNEQLDKEIVTDENGSQKMKNAPKHGLNIYTDVLNVAEAEGNPIKTAKQFTERFIEECNKRGWIPRFHRFLNRAKDGRFLYTPGFHKFLLDFKMFDKNGKILPQEPVVPIFDNEFNKQILDEYVKDVKEEMPNEAVYEAIKKEIGLVENIEIEDTLDDVKEGESRFRIRTKPAPKETKPVYKLMRLGNDGKLYPLYIDSTAPVELNVWYDADSPNMGDLKKLPSGIHLINSEGKATSWDEYKSYNNLKGVKPNAEEIKKAADNGSRWVKIVDKNTSQKRYEGEARSYYNLGINGSGGVSEFAMRPGWHAGSLPTMRQIGKGTNKDLRDDSFVWVEGEVSADKNYQAEAESNPDNDIPTHIPEDGYYMKATNANKNASQADRVGWYVAGSFKANRIIGDSEARSVIDKWNAEHPSTPVLYDFKRESGKDFEPSDIRFRVTPEYKQHQMDIINATNPAPESNYTWIRSVEDIKTFEESLDDTDYADYKGEDFDPSYTWDMAEEALNTGKVTVYSSHPIKNGVFVTPSYMEAQSYGGTTPYMAKVNLEDVAWIDPTQGQLATDNKVSSKKAPNGLRFRVSNQNQEIFVSNAQKAAEGIKQEKATPQQWLAMIEKNGGLKAGEDKWLGLSDWLKDSDKKSITKAEILDFINQNKIRIEEVHYGEEADMISKDEVLYSDEFQSLIDSLTEYDDEDQPYINTKLFDELKKEDFNFYNGFSIDYWGESIDIDDAESAGRYLGLWGDRVNAINNTRLGLTSKGLENNREIALTIPTIAPYHMDSSWDDEVHFGDAGDGRAVAWVRFGETTDSDGNRVLVIDEIQSKRHQDGREKGYSSQYMSKIDEYNKNYELAFDEYDKYFKNTYNKEISDYSLNELEQLRSKDSELNRLYQDYRNILKEKFEFEDKAKNAFNVPDAPFEKNWHELAMKRMLRLAAEEGFDKVAWTKGEQQAERYNLGAVLQGLKAYKTSTNTYYVIPYNNGAIGEFVKEYTEKELADTFGKELAAKIIANTEDATEDNPYEIEGDNLRIGGEGMKGFYDQILPRFVNKYVKKWGTKVQEVELPELEDSAQKMWSVDVTPEMKDSVMEGQVMFRVKDAVRDSFNLLNSRYKGRNFEAVVLDELNDDELLDLIGMTVEDREELRNDIDEIRKHFGNKKRLAFNNPFTGKIIIFADRIKPEKVEEVFFHENIHAVLEYLYGDGHRDIAEHFWDIAPDDGLVGRKHIEDNYIKENQKEELFTFWLSRAMVYGNIDSVLDLLGNEDKETINEILNLIGYDRTREENSRRENTRKQTESEGVYQQSRQILQGGALLGGQAEGQQAGLEPLSETDPLKRAEQIRFRERSVSSRLQSAVDLYEAAVMGVSERSFVEMIKDKTLFGRFRNEFVEAWVDGVRAVKALQKAIEASTGKNVEGYEDVYHSLNAKSSKDGIESEMVKQHLVLPLMTHVAEMTKGKEVDGKVIDMDDVEKYMNAVHGIERNKRMAERELEAYIDRNAKNPKDEKERETLRKENAGKFRKDYSGLTALFKNEGEGNVSINELERRAQAYAEQFEAAVGKDNAEKMWKLVGALNGYSLEKSYQSGIISKEQYEETSSMYDHYIPLRGWHDDYAGDVYQYITRGAKDVMQRTLRTAHGRTSRAGDIFGTMEMMAVSSIMEGNKNLVKQKLFHLARNTGKDTGLLMVTNLWYEKNANDELVPVDIPYLDSDMTAEEMRQSIEEHEERMKELEKEDKVFKIHGKGKFRKTFPLHMKKWQEQAHAVRVLVGGEEKLVYVLGNPRAAMAINGLLSKDAQKDEQNLSRWTMAYMRWLSSAITSWSPEFLVGNMQRDLLDALATSYISAGRNGSRRFAKNYASLVGKDAIFGLIKAYKEGKLDLNRPTHRYFKEFMDNGGMAGVGSIYDEKRYQSEMRKMMKHVQMGKMDLPRKAWEGLTNMVEFANQGIENATRFAGYISSRQSGKSITESIYDSKELTTNFNMKGSGAWGNLWVRRYILFANPAIQSLRKMIEMAGAHPKRFWGTAVANIAAGFVTALLNYLAAANDTGDDDDDNDYWKLNSWNKYNYINIYLGKGNGFFHWSVPHDKRPYWTLGCVTFDWAMGRITGERALQSMMAALFNLSPIAFYEGGSDTDDSIWKGFLKGITPNVFKPFADAYGWNEDFMGGRITGQTDFNKHLPEWQRVTGKSPQFVYDWSRAFNEAMGGRRNERSQADSPAFNPDALWYIFMSNTGGIGQMASRLIKMSEQLNDPDLNGDEFNWRNVPFVPKWYVGVNTPSAKNKVVNDKFWLYWTEFQATDKELSKNEKDVSSGQMTAEEQKQAIEERKSDGTYQSWDKIEHSGLASLYDYTKKVEDDSLMQQVREWTVDLIEKGKQPDYGSVFDASEDAETRKALGKAIAQKNGTNDSYGKKPDREAKGETRDAALIYQNERTSQDMEEDTRLLKMKQDADDAGDERLSKYIEKQRDAVNDKRLGLGKRNADIAEVMKSIREERKKSFKNIEKKMEEWKKENE